MNLQAMETASMNDRRRERLTFLSEMRGKKKKCVQIQMSLVSSIWDSLCNLPNYGKSINFKAYTNLTLSNMVGVECHMSFSACI